MKEKHILTRNKKDEINFNRFKKFLFLEITKELIRNNSPEQMLKLKELLEKEKKIKDRSETTKIKVKEIIESKKREEELFREMTPSIAKAKGLSFALSQEEPKKFPIYKKVSKEIPELPKAHFPARHKIQIAEPFKKLKLTIPETRFPPHLQYVKPTFINKEIDLGNLNPFLKDNFVKTIECYGPNQNLIVRGGMGAKKIGIILDKDGIIQIIKRFSEETKIPIQEGVFKVALGRMMFMAIISEVLGSKFIIRKMQPIENYQMQPSRYI